MKLFFNKNQEGKILGRNLEFGIWNFERIHSIFHLRAFTLVELLVSTAIFSSAVIIGVGALYSAQQINIKLQATHTIMDSLNLSLEIMTRNMRYGSSFYCATDKSISSGNTANQRKSCPYDTNSSNAGGSKIVFKTVDSVNRTAYYLDNNHLMEAEYDSGSGVTISTKQISLNEVVIDNLHFYVTGATLSDTNQPMVTMSISGRIKASKQEVAFNLQSSVTSRNSK